MAPEIKPSSPSRISRVLQRLGEILVSFWGWLTSSFSRLHSIKTNPKQNETSDKPDNKSHFIVATIQTPKAISVEAKTKEYKGIGSYLFGFLEGVGIVAVIVYAFLTHNMWREMQSQTRIQREINKPVIVPYWVGTYHSKEAKQMWAIMTVKNIGNTDAKFISIAIKAEFRISGPEKLDYKFGEEDFKRTNLPLLTPFVLAQQVADMGNDLTRPLPSDEYSKGKRFYVWGKFLFQDSVGPLPESSFCEFATENVLDPKYNLVSTALPWKTWYQEPYQKCKTQ